MKTLVFNRDSWHYKVAKFGGWEESSDDLCSYVRRIGFAALKFAFFSALVVGLCFVVVDIVLGLYFSLITWTWMMNEWGMFGLFLILALSALCLWITVYCWVADWKEVRRRKARQNGEQETDNFIKHAYASWKDKYCAKVTFIDHEDSKSA